MSRQQPLFETEPAPWELDQASEQLVATVVFPGGPQTVFHYRVPDGLRDQMEPGRRVRARLDAPTECKSATAYSWRHVPMCRGG